jgi:undecaprenyl-diphosphatase
MPPPDRLRLRLRHAAALGALHGPAELLPISSSGHITLVPWLLRWPYAELDPELRKAYEVALHAGTAAGLLVGLRSEVSDAVVELDRRRLALITLSFVPPAIVGYALERPIERRLGTPGTIAVGLVAGSLAMLAADRTPQTRTSEEAGARDAVWLGVAQATALVPGVSRNGATLAAARWRGFRRRDANRLSRHVALPIITGASLLKGVRLARRGLPAETGAAFGVGVIASFVSTLLSRRAIGLVERDRPLAWWAAYRLALAGIVSRRLLRENREVISS